MGRQIGMTELSGGDSRPQSEGRVGPKKRRDAALPPLQIVQSYLMVKEYLQTLVKFCPVALHSQQILRCVNL